MYNATCEYMFGGCQRVALRVPHFARAPTHEYASAAIAACLNWGCPRPLCVLLDCVRKCECECALNRKNSQYKMCLPLQWNHNEVMSLVAERLLECMCPGLGNDASQI